MLSLRSLAFILASARRRARALFSASFHRFPDSISGRKVATKMATKTDTKILTKTAVDSMSVPYEESTPSRLGRESDTFLGLRYVHTQDVTFAREEFAR
jgi:hypothetical protein